MSQFHSNYYFGREEEEIETLFNDIVMERSPNYGRNSNILIPDPYH
jgi:hypothetical protein